MAPPKVDKTAKKPPAKPKSTTKAAGAAVSTAKPKNPKRAHKKVDWEAVERDYRTTNMTDDELATIHGVSREAVTRKRNASKKDDPASWARDLAPAVRAATNALLMQEEVTETITDSHKQVTNAVLVAATTAKDVVLGHRVNLKRITALSSVLMGHIETAASNMEDLSDIIEMARSPDERNQDKQNDALRKAMERPALIDDLKKLAEINERVIKGERQAFRMDEKDPDEGDGKDKSKMMSDAERAVRLYALLSKADAK